MTVDECKLLGSGGIPCTIGFDQTALSKVVQKNFEPSQLMPKHFM